VKAGLNSILLIVSVVLCLSCSKENAEPFDPDKVVIDYDKLSATAIDEFLAFAKTPRTGGYMEEARDYLINWAANHGYQAQHDALDNVWFDVPATSGLEYYPTIILQGHMDMICACKSGETYDFTETVGEPYYEGEGEDRVLKGRYVNLGADNGIGVGTALSIASMDVPHGPLRILFTANEDYDMSGASEIARSVIDAPYLINIDSEDIGHVTYGCAGSIAAQFHKQYDTAVPEDISQYSKVTLKVFGLRGGHSGLDIGDHRLSGSVITDSIINRVVDPFGAKLIMIDCGTYDNAISNSTQMEFAIINSDTSEVHSQLIAIQQSFEKEYPEESASWSIDVNGDLTYNDICCDILCTDQLKDILKQFPQGVLETNAEGRITKSNNVGVIELADGALDFHSMERSDFEEWIESESSRIQDVAYSYGMTLDDLTLYPAWYGDGTDILTQMMKSYYCEAGYDAVLEMSLGGLETAYFVQNNTNITCVSVGPTVTNAHSIDEALTISTVKPLIQVIMQTLLHLNVQ